MVGVVSAVGRDREMPVILCPQWKSVDGGMVGVARRCNGQAGADDCTCITLFLTRSRRVRK